jgi:NAD(P)-dependent dehydrogenase (short-subunit alcohol dehydrogenase family)
MNILITGASSGIGYQTALLLVKKGHTVFALARSADKLEKLKEASLKLNSSAKLHLIAGDLTNESFMEKIKEKISAQAISLDVLINNAGFLINKPFEELTTNDWQDVYATNVFAPVQLIQRLLPLFSPGENKRHIVNIASMGGVQGSQKFKGLSAYSSAKAAIIGITECLAEELSEKKIAVNCLALGSAQTEMFSKAFPGIKAGVTAEEMASFIAWFAIEGQNIFNGKIIPVANSTP